jgi:hypothetical protein
MTYEITLTVSIHPDAAFAKVEDHSRLENVYSLVESALFDIDDLTLHDLEVMEQEE